MKISTCKSNYIYKWTPQKQTKLLRALVWLDNRGFKVSNRMNDMRKLENGKG